MQQHENNHNETSPQSAELFRLIVENVKDYAIFMTDAEGRVVSWNPGVERLLGYAESEIVGQPVSIIFTPEDTAQNVHIKEMETAAHDGCSEDKRWHVRQDGSRFWANGLTMLLKNDDGTPRGFAKIMRDETGEKLAEEKIGESNERISNILESITDAFYALDHEWRFTYLNRQAEILLRRNRAELINKNVWNEFPETVGSTFERQYHKAAAEQISVSFEEFYPPLETWFEVRAYPSPDGLSVYFHNINERKRAEEGRLEQTRMAALNGDIGIALVTNDSLRNLLKRCAEILVEHLDVAFARIWTYYEDEKVLELQASAGIYTHLDGAHSRVPIGKFKIGLIAEERLPHLTNDVQNDPRVGDKDWAKRENMQAFAGYPLIVADRLVGVMCVFARRPLTEITLEAMASVSNAIANGIERKRIEEVFRESEERYRIVAETASDAIISINEQSIILFINKAAERVFGYKIEEMIGQSLKMLMPEYLRHVHNAGLKRYIETGKRHIAWERVEVPALHKNGHEFPIEISFGEFLKNDHHVFIGVARDISERKRVETEREHLLQAEQTARLQAENANRLKDEFLATVSHELRTPLNAILGWSQMLKSNKFSETAVENALTTIERNARAQNQLIDDLLDVSRIITGKLRLNVRAVDLPGVINAAVDAVHPAAEAKEIRLQMLLDPSAETISGDPDRLQQIVWNLLSNAVKFTPKGGRIQVRLERINSHVEISVADTGQGIEPEFLPLVFDRFRQGDQTTTRKYGGLGLGLAIVRQLAELHGGQVSVESSGEGKGATFTVVLPVLPIRTESAGDERRVHPAARTDLIFDNTTDLGGLRVLVVDDEADTRGLLEMVLRTYGAEVTVAASAAEAVRQIETGTYDVLITDIGMPEEDGYSLIRQVRMLPTQRGGSIPAVALTAYARAEDRVRALRSGFQMHVSKPVESAELLTVVANLAGRAGDNLLNDSIED